MMQAGRSGLLALASALFTVALFEVACRLALEEERSPSVRAEGLHERIGDDRLGYRLKPDSSYRARKDIEVDGSITNVYDVRYTSDSLQRRSVGHRALPGAPHVMVFGGSYAWGEGLPDEETLQYQLKLRLPHTNVYNYGVHGWGAANMLALLENVELEREVSSPRGIGLYVWLDFHVDRNTGSILTPWTDDFPYYERAQAGSLISRGSILERRPVVAALNRSLRTLQEHSALLSRIHLDFARWFVDPTQLMADLIVQSRDSYAGRFEGEFVVLNHPWNRREIQSAEDRRYRGMLERVLGILAQARVRVVTPAIAFREESYIRFDGHPSGSLNREVAEHLIALDLFRAL